MAVSELIPFAGYDPNENDFSMIKLEPRYGFDFGREINVKRAVELRAKGLKWREVSVLLAHECRRKIPFQPQSVMCAVYGYNNRKV